MNYYMFIQINRKRTFITMLCAKIYIVALYLEVALIPRTQIFYNTINLAGPVHSAKEYRDIIVPNHLT